MLSNQGSHRGPSSFLNRLNNASLSPGDSNIISNNSTYQSPIHNLMPPTQKVAPGAPRRKVRTALLSLDANEERGLFYAIELDDPFTYLIKKLEEIGIEVKTSDLDLNEKDEHEKTKLCIDWMEKHCSSDWKCYLSKAFTDKFCSN